ncbi:MAG: hypothetical protein AAGA48_14855 [Myxococcota bacterium]
MPDIYTITLFAHSWTRWAVLLAALGLGAASVFGWQRQSPWTTAHDRLHLTFVGLVDIQVTLGLALYFGLSPLSQAFLANPAETMGIRELRFFGLEHITMMALALVTAHLGRMRVRRLDDARRHRAATISVAVFLLLVVFAVPWPFSLAPRPWFRI